MSLRQYEVDFSQLTLDEKADLIKRIEDNAFTGPDYKQGFQSAVFCIEEKDISFLKIPACCSLRCIS